MITWEAITIKECSNEEFSKILDRATLVAEQNIKALSLKSFNDYTQRFGWNFTMDQFDSYCSAMINIEEDEDWFK